MNEEAGLRISASQKIEMGKRMRQLRESVKLPQTVMAEKAHSTQSTIAKVEAGTASPSLGLLLWYAEYFDVSLDYLCCRTNNPEGKLFENKPKIEIDSDEMKRFIEMCFDPDSAVSRRFKDALLSMVTEDNK